MFGLIGKGKMMIVLVIVLLITIIVFINQFDKIGELFTGDTKENLKIEKELLKDTVKDLKVVIIEKEKNAIMIKKVEKVKEKIIKAVDKKNTVLDNKEKTVKISIKKAVEDVKIEEVYLDKEVTNSTNVKMFKDEPEVARDLILLIWEVYKEKK